MKRLATVAFFALAAMVLTPAAALAIPIVLGSQIGYVGAFDTATESFLTSSEVNINSADVNVVSGSFVGTVADGDPLSHATPIEYDPPNASISPLWTHSSGLAFDLTDYMLVFVNANLLNLVGTGVFSGGGFDITPGEWNMTLNRVTGFAEGNFSATSAAQPQQVPEPGSLALLGLGLLAAYTYRRRASRP